MAPDRTFRAAETPGGPHSGSHSQMLHLQLHPSDLPDTLAWRGCTQPHPLEHYRMRRHVLLAQTASHLAVDERCAFGVLGEPEARDRLLDLLPDGRGQRWHPSRGRRPVGRDAAAFIPISEAADAQNGRWQAMAENRSVCQGASYGVLMGVLLLVPQLPSLQEPSGRPNVRSFELTNGPARLKAKLLARRWRRSRPLGCPAT